MWLSKSVCLCGGAGKGLAAGPLVVDNFVPFITPRSSLTFRWRDSFVETRRASHFRRPHPSTQRWKAQIGRTQLLAYHRRGRIGFRQLHVWNWMGWHPDSHYSQVSRVGATFHRRCASRRPWPSWPTHWSTRRQPSPIGVQSWRHTTTHR